MPSKDVSVNLELVGETFIHHLEQKKNNGNNHQNSTKSLDEKTIPPKTSPKENLMENLKEENFVVVQWNGLEFPGITMSVTDAGAIFECMERTKKFWKWPLVKDSLFYEWASITKIINPPRLMKRGLFHVSNKKKIKSN